MSELKITTHRTVEGQTNFRNRESFLKLVGILRQSDYGVPKYRELIDLMESQPLHFIRGQPVIFVDGFAERENKLSPAHKNYFIIFIDRNIPAPFFKIILNHELREQLLENAGYTERVAHSIARKKEWHELQAKGELDNLMSYLEKNYPLAYDERVRAWNYAPAKKKSPSSK